MIGSIKVNNITKMVSPGKQITPPKRNKRVFKYFDDFILNLLLHKNPNDSNYILTCSILRTFYPGSELRGYNYPSVADRNGTNVAFNPKYENNKLFVKKVELFEKDNCDNFILKDTIIY